MNFQCSQPVAEAGTTRSTSPKARTKNNTPSMNGGSSLGTSHSGPQPYEDEDDGGWNESTSTTRTSATKNTHRRTRPPMANVTNRRIEAQAIGLFKSVVGTLLNNCHLCTLYCDEQVRYETQQEATEEPVDKDWIQAQYEIGTGSIGHLFTTATNNINRNTTTHSNAASTTARPTPPPTDYSTTMGNWNNNNHNIIQDPHEHHTNGRTLSLATIPTDNTTATAASKKTNHPQQVQSTSSTIVRL